MLRIFRKAAVFGVAGVTTAVLSQRPARADITPFYLDDHGSFRIKHMVSCDDKLTSNMHRIFSSGLIISHSDQAAAAVDAAKEYARCKSK